MRQAFSAALALAATFSLSLAQSNIPQCGPNNPCPADTPCCSQYGQCGVGAYCLGGCDPIFSYSLDSCVPAPMCRSEDYKLNSLDDVIQNTEYLGDASKHGWVSSGTPVSYNDEAILLTMPPDTVGTLLMSTHYVWYGKVSATMTSSQGAGVVTAFILMSDVKDEIDFEWVGTDLEHAQSNYYFQGITDYENGGNLSVSNTVENVHTYSIDWQPDHITWSIDGEEMRTVNRDDTWNETSQQYHFPQTPSRVQLSLWPGGLPSNGEGTIAWAGGLVDWNSDAMQNGYYYAMVNDITIECYDPPRGYDNQGDKSYIYTDAAGTNDTIRTVDEDGILASFYATGENKDKDPNAPSPSSKSKTSAASSGSSATSSATSEPETVPGISGGGARGEDGAPQGGAGNSNSNGGSSNSGSSGDPSSDDSSSDDDSGSNIVGNPNFSQGEAQAQDSGNGGTSDGTKASASMAGSAVALLGFIAVALMI